MTDAMSSAGDPAARYNLLLEDILERPRWHARAACRGVGADQFFPAGGEPATGVSLCFNCPVMLECAAAGEGEEGWWGGLPSVRPRRRKRAA